MFILYTAEILGCCSVYGKTFEGKTFTFRVENGCSLEKFYSSMLVDLHCQSTRPTLPIVNNLWENIRD